MSARPPAQPPRRPNRQVRSVRSGLPHAWGDPDPTPAEPARTRWSEIRPYAPTWDDNPSGDHTQAHTPTWDDTPGYGPTWNDGTRAYSPIWDDQAEAGSPALDGRTEAYGPTAHDGTQAPTPDADDEADGRGHHQRPSRQELAPWAHGRAPGSAGVATIVAAKVGPAPVFVDDSGRRRRAGRLVGTTVVVAVAAYTAVIALTLAGVPMVGQVAPPGIDRLARPAGDTRVVTGPSAEEVPLPPPPEETPSSATTTEASDGDTAPTSSDPDPTGSTAPSTTTAAPTTTTTAAHGPSTTLTSPGTTAPGRGNGSGRPPSPPGQG